MKFFVDQSETQPPDETELTFSELIACSIGVTTGEPAERYVLEADDIVAMPEMQAIRDYLRMMARQMPGMWHKVRVLGAQEGVELPQSIVEWVLAEPEDSSSDTRVFPSVMLRPTAAEGHTHHDLTTKRG